MRTFARTQVQTSNRGNLQRGSIPFPQLDRPGAAHPLDLALKQLHAAYNCIEDGKTGQRQRMGFANGGNG